MSLAFGFRPQGANALAVSLGPDQRVELIHQPGLFRVCGRRDGLVRQAILHGQVQRRGDVQNLRHDVPRQVLDVPHDVVRGVLAVQ